MTTDQLNLDLDSPTREADVDRAIRRERAELFERAAERLGMRGGRKSETGWRLAGMIAVYVDSPSMREAGLTGLRWQGTTTELAADPRLRCDKRTVQRVLAIFERAGLIIKRTITDDRGDAGIEIELQMQNLRAFAEGQTVHVTPDAGGDVARDIGGDIPHDIGGDTAPPFYIPYLPVSVDPSSPNSATVDGEFLELENKLRSDGCIEQIPRAMRMVRAGLKNRALTLRRLHEAIYVAKYRWRTPQDRGKYLYAWIRDGAWPKHGVPSFEEFYGAREAEAKRITGIVYEAAAAHRARGLPVTKQGIAYQLKLALEKANLDDFVKPIMEHAEHEI